MHADQSCQLLSRKYIQFAGGKVDTYVVLYCAARALKASICFTVLATGEALIVKSVDLIQQCIVPAIVDHSEDGTEAPSQIALA